MKNKISLAEAERIARFWEERLESCCWRIGIAGSIRRKCEAVGDVEIVAIPQRTLFSSLSLFPGPEKPSHETELNIMKGVPGIKKGTAKYIQIRDNYNRKATIDLFLATPETWGVILAIRTGSAEFSHGLMVRANRIGLTSYRGRLVPNSELIRGGNGKVKSMGLAAPLETPEERDVFEALQIQWVEPPMRRGFSDVKSLQS